MSVVPLDVMRDWTIQVLIRVGLTESDAEAVAASLAFAEARGVGTHGLIRLSTYVERIRAGGINKAARIRTEADLGALVIVDADDAPGASSGVYGADLAIERAREYGIGCVIARNGNHFGASAFFTNRIADAGLLGLVACNTESVMCAPFGGRPVLGTNPFAVAVPLPYEQRPQVDMATTTVPQGKLLVAAQNGEDIPLGWAVDTQGRPTTSPAEGLKGALTPAGGPKGFGLAFAVDALVALAGANVSPAVTALNGDPSLSQRQGHLFLAIRADATGSLSEYHERIGQLVNAIHHSGVDGEGVPPLAPGEPELIHERKVDGCVALTDGLLDQLRALAADTEVPLPGPLEAVAN
ncbi:Ldh family oxidoreductase [Planosporangium flavigriseum]|uniref:Lactate dehydrogenase n=1 Tax=Planosporangium flavigriseum TaxID=373681 RepID=A0A8J3M2K4_9ACTN|nr:Ldh family oxidoreductase [Planosporangium flavigriseum]NJC67465.1 Ldh family oxidoreductase [Planosporangium flavigriseum]GIG75585.1 lactate dehydrogenase [Planosporangium flavigriseum]